MTQEDENKLDARYNKAVDRIIKAKRMENPSANDYLWAINKFRLIFNKMEQDLLKIQKKEILNNVKQKCSDKKL